MASLRRVSKWHHVYSEPSSPPPSPEPCSGDPFGDRPHSLLNSSYGCAGSRDRLYANVTSNDPLQRIWSIPMSLNKASSLLILESGSQSRGESTLESEALVAVHELAFAVQSISVSEMLPRTPELIFVNVTTLEGQPYCLELTNKGWRVTSLRTDCMIGDFTRMELFTKYYESLFALMNVISPDYKERFSEKLAQRLRLLEAGENADFIAPPSSYVDSPLHGSCCITSRKSTSTSTDSSLIDGPEHTVDPIVEHDGEQT